MNIREATKKDIPIIREMMKDLFLTWDKIDEMDKIDENWFLSKKSDNFISQRMLSKNQKYLVAECNAEIAGYIFGLIEVRQACMDKNIGLIDELFVKPGYRKLGLGKALTEKMLDFFRSQKIKWSILLTHSRDVGANSYWTNYGYKDYNRKYRMKL